VCLDADEILAKTGRLLGTIEPDIIRLDKLYIGGFHGWRVWSVSANESARSLGLNRRTLVGLNAPSCKRKLRVNGSSKGA
jgi:hypothetical protein